MSYALIEDIADDHPKMLALLGHGADGLAAYGLWCATLTWARRHTDPARIERAGRLPRGIVQRFAGEHAERLAQLLVDARGVSDTGLWVPADYGWQIHKFRHWQQLDAWRAKSAQAQSASRKRWGPPKQTGPDLFGNAGADAGASPDAYAGADASAIPISDHVISDHSPNGERARNSRAHRLPEDWQPDRKLLIWARDKHPGVDAERETDAFRLYWLAEGGQRASKVDWRRAWQTWMNRAPNAAPRRSSGMIEDEPGVWDAS